MFSAGNDVIFVQVVPVRRHKCAPAPAAPKRYATSGAAVTRSTAKRVQPLVGPEGRATAVKEFPALVETKSPSTNEARSSPIPPLGWRLMSQHLPARFKLHDVPLLIDL